MIHIIKVSIFVEFDTEHPNFDQSKDADAVLAEARECFADMAGEEDGDGMSIAHVQVEYVE